MDASRTLSLIAAGSLTLACALMQPCWADAPTTLERRWTSVALGMSVSEVQRHLKVVKAPDDTVALMRKFGLGDPDELEKADKAIGKVGYKCNSGLPEGVHGCDLFLRSGIVYQIAV